MATETIRRATSADAEALTALGRETFVAKFGDLYVPDDLAEFLATAHTPRRYAAWAEDPRYGLWIVEEGGKAIGYALAGPCELPHPDVTPACGELKRLYMLPEAQGRGAGRRLLQTAFDWLERPGRAIWLGVYSDNVEAQRFYARRGFVKVGEYLFPVGRQMDREHILRRAG